MRSPPGAAVTIVGHAAALVSLPIGDLTCRLEHWIRETPDVAPGDRVRSDLGRPGNQMGRYIEVMLSAAWLSISVRLNRDAIEGLRS